MDPLSITASAIACLGAVKGAIKGLQKTGKYIHAKQDIDTLVNDLEDVQALLQGSLELITNGDFTSSQKQFLQQQLLRLGNKIKELDGILNAPRHHIPGVSEERQAQFSWIKHESKIRALRTEMVDTKTNVTNALTIITASSTTGIGRSLTTSVDLQHQHLRKLSGLIDKVNVIEKAVRGFHGSRKPPSLAEEDARSSDQPSQVITYTDQDQGNAVPCQTEGMEVVSRSTNMVPPAKTDSRWHVKSMEKCAKWCSCRCHSKTTVVVPRFLRSVVGKTVVEYAGTQQSCNEYTCRRSKKAGLELSYCIPKYLSRQYVFVRMSRAPLGNPTVVLRMPRTMDWTHPLWKYAPKGDLTAVRSLIKSAKAAADDTNFQGGTALLLASGHPELYQYLIKEGADLNVADMHGRKPVNLIGEKLLSGRIPEKHTEATEELLAETDFMESRQFTTIHKSVLQLSESVLAEELRKTTSSVNAIDAEGRTPLIWATMRNDLGTMNTLLEFGADPNARDYAGNAPLHYVRGSDAGNALIDAGADVHIRNRTRRRTPVHLVCKNTDDPELIDLFHDSGADIDVRDVDSETPLLHAVSCNFTETSKELIKLGADVNAANDSSRDSAIHFAVAFDHHEIIPTLLQHGADYTHTNIHGRSIAHKAAAWATRYTIESLSRLNLADLNLNVQDVDGKTARDSMAEREVLLESEAGIHAKFAQFAKAVEEAKAKKEENNGEPEVGITRKGTDLIRPPGTYPSHG